MKILSLFVGSVSFLLGLAVLVGWHLNSQLLIQVFPGFAPMQYNTAIGFLLCGTSLLAVALGKPIVGLVAGGLLGILGGITAGEYIFALDIGFDQLFMKNRLIGETLHSGRMAPNAALSFTLSGVALSGAALVGAGKVRIDRIASLVSGVNGSVVIALGAIAFFGYLGGVGSSTDWAQLTRMAVHTAAGFFLVGIGLIAQSMRETTIQAKSTPRLLPIMGGVGMVAAALSLWQVLATNVGNTPSSLPIVVLLFGLVSALLLVASLQLVETARNREKKLEQLNDQLAAEISEREHAQAELQELQAKTQAILETAADAIITVDDNGIIETFNLAAERVFGYQESEVLGKNVSMLMPTGSGEQPHEYLEGFVHTGKSKVITGEQDGQAPFSEQMLHKEQALRKGGSTFPVELAVSEVKTVGKRLFTRIVRDITERTRAEKLLVEYARRLEQSNRELEEFAYAASHDLQEPLRKVRSFSERLVSKFGEQLTDQGRDYIDRMQGATIRMQALITDLLQFSRVTTAARPFERVDLNKVIKDVLSDLEVSIEEAHAGVVVGDLPTIDAEPTQMRQLLQNLISNSLKFRLEGEPLEVEIQSQAIAGIKGGQAEGTQPERYFRISVKDNGIGIDEKYFDRIFGIFQRLHGRDEYEGTGVGLAICRKIAENHGGSITAEGTPGEGVTFNIDLPEKQVLMESANE